MKPPVHQEQVQSLLDEHFNLPISRLTPLEGGEIARTFSFTAGNQDYVVRFNHHMGANFEKEALIAGWLEPTDVPIPPIVHLGRLGDLHYAISRKAQGKSFLHLEHKDFQALVPEMIRMLDAIHAVEIDTTTGYGTFDDGGTGLFSSWRQYLLSIWDEEPEWEFFGKWHALFETTFLERELFKDLYQRMASLADYCPEDRYLVHGDYGFGNVLTQDGKITAVIDWIDAKYGDFLFDVAWLDFWAVEIPFAQLFHDHYLNTGREIGDYPERLRCYQHHIGLDALRFYAKAGSEPSYRWARDRVLAL